MIAGCDEAGAGPGFGDLIASAVILTTPIEGLTDSKKLSEKKRDAYFKQITESCIFGIGRVSNVEIDQHGLAWARRIVFHRALDDMMTRTSTLPESIIVDGTIFDPWRNIPFECKPKADLTDACVSAASIVAKVTRDQSIYDLCDTHPWLDEQYGLRSNKGYLSAPKHKEGLRTFGLTDWHRKSYNIKL